MVEHDRGNIYKRDNHYYLLTTCGYNSEDGTLNVALICMNGEDRGNRFIDPVRVDHYPLSQTEWLAVTDGDGDKFKLHEMI
jgi:hypothetical protein